jgi:2-keto-4-pentenoate hydratase
MQEIVSTRRTQRCALQSPHSGSSHRVEDLPGGALEALRFLLGHLAERRRPLRKGQWVRTGAITGVHQIFPGQRGSINCFGHADINVLIETAVPEKI